MPGRPRIIDSTGALREADASFLTNGLPAGAPAADYENIQGLTAPLLFTSVAGVAAPLRARTTRDAADAAGGLRAAFEAMSQAGAAGASTHVGFLVSGTLAYQAHFAALDQNLLIRPYLTQAVAPPDPLAIALPVNAGRYVQIVGGSGRAGTGAAGGNVLLYPGAGDGAGLTGEVQVVNADGSAVRLRVTAAGVVAADTGPVVVGAAVAVGAEKLRVTGGTSRFEAEVTSTVVGDAVMPSADAQGNVGSDARRWLLVRAVTVTSGDYGFDDETCAACGQAFDVGDDVAFQIRHKEGKTSLAVPIHFGCAEPRE